MAVAWTLAVEIGGGHVSAVRRGPDGSHSVVLSEGPVSEDESFLTSVLRQAQSAVGTDLPEELIVVHPASWSGPDLAMVGQAAAAAELPQPEFIARSFAFARSGAADLPPGTVIAILDGASTGYEVSILERTRNGFRLRGSVGSVSARAQTPDAVMHDEDLTSAAARELAFVLAEADVAPDAVRRLLVAGPAARSPRTSALVSDLSGIPGRAIQVSTLSAAEAALMPPKSGVRPLKRHRVLIAIVCASLVIAGIGGFVWAGHEDGGSAKTKTTADGNHSAVLPASSASSASSAASAASESSGSPASPPSDTTHVDVAPNSPVPPAPGTRSDFVINDRDAAAITPIDSTAGTNAAPISLGTCKANVVVTNHAVTESYAQCPTYVQPIDLTTGKLGTPITTPMMISDIALSPDGSTLFVLTGNSSLTESRISFVDTATGRMTTPVSIQGNVSPALTMTPDGKHLYVTETGPDMVGSYGTSYVIAVDTASRTVVAKIALPVEPAGVVSLPDSRDIYVACPVDQDVVRIDTATNTMDQSIPIDQIPVTLAATQDSSTLYALGNGLATQIDVQTGNTVRKISVDPGANTMAVSPDGARVYLYGDSTSDALAYFDTASGEAGASIRVGEAPTDIDFTPDGKEALVIVVGQNGGTPGTTVVGLHLPSDTVGFSVRILPGYAFFSGHKL